MSGDHYTTTAHIRLLAVQDLESRGSNFEIYSLADWEPMQVDQNRRDATVTRSFEQQHGQGCSERDEDETDF